jgi:hypothetical protein
MASFGYMLRVGRAHAPRGCPGGVRSPQGASRPTRAHMAPVASEPREGEPFFTGGSLSMGHSAWKNEPDGPWTGEGPVCDSPLDEWGRCGGARAGGHGANKSSVLANCGLGARPHSLLPRTRAWRIPESRRRARRRNATRRRPLTRRSGRCRPSPASRGCDVRSQRPPFCWGTDALGTSTPWGLTDT